MTKKPDKMAATETAWTKGGHVRGAHPSLFGDFATDF